MVVEYLPEFLTVAVVHFLALISPGPDFMLIARNSLFYSRKAGIYSALGLSLGILVHTTYSLAGIALIISKSILLFSVMKFLAAGYLIYIGYKSLASKTSENGNYEGIQGRYLSRWGAFRMGFLTNVTNPKVTLFFLSLFTVVINPLAPFSVKLLYGIWMSAVTFCWFALVATFFSHHLIQQRAHGIQHYAEKFMGVILIALGIKLATSTSK